MGREVGRSGRDGGSRRVRVLDMVGAAHGDLDADPAILNAARNECTEFYSTDNLNKGVDAKFWALDYGVDLGAGIETCV